VKKLKKFIKNPGIFFRDYLNKKHPLILNELNYPKQDEGIIIEKNINLELKEVVNFPIDAVFTWVNDNDPAWKEKLYKYKDINLSERGAFSSDMARFNNHDELKYSVESILKNLKWIRKIFIITDNQVPNWYIEEDEKFKKIVIVNHNKIINQQYLPTFNSHVIEAHLHHIDDLSEHFIYFNDDVFVARDLPSGHFFKGNGIASLFASSKSIKSMRDRGVDTPTLFACTRSADLIRRDYKIDIDTPLIHTYIPLRKSIYYKVWNKYKNEIDSFLDQKFRSNNDLNLATFLVPWIAYNEGLSTHNIDICYYFNIRSTAARRHYSELLVGKKSGLLPHSFCANDFNSESNIMPDYKLKLHRFLSSYFQ